jgi:hypothetical protein
MTAKKQLPVAFLLCSVSTALALILLSGCNLLLGNDKRSLSQHADPNVVSADAAMDAATDAGEDAGPAHDGGSAEPGACGGVAFRQCVPNAIDMGTQACGDCGAGTRTRERGCTISCQWASWSEWSECREPADVCKPGATEEKMEACGNCNLGTRKTTRTCTSSCGWSDWSPGICAEKAETCMPGMIRPLADVGCGTMCGHAAQSQTCSNSCAWGPVMAGMCTSEGMCKPGTTRMAADGGCNPNYCNKGVQPRMETCTQSCTWGTPTTTGMCTIPTNVCRPMDLGGTGMRCRVNDPGYGERCYNSTAAAANACTWTGVREAFSGC